MPIAPDVYKKIVSAKIFIDDRFRELRRAASTRSPRSYPSMGSDTLDLDRLSREACLSRYHFHRLFTRIYKRTPQRGLRSSPSPKSSSLERKL